MCPTDPQSVRSQTASPAPCCRVTIGEEGEREFVWVPCGMQSLGHKYPNCGRVKLSSGILSLCLNDFFFLQSVAGGANGPDWSSKVCRVFSRELAKKQVYISHRQRQELNVSFTVRRMREEGRRQQAPHRHWHHTIFLKTAVINFSFGR